MRLNQLVRTRLRALLKQHGVTQTELARAAKERQQDVNRFFKGDMVNPPLDFLEGLANVFQYTLADLLTAELRPPSLTRDELTLLAAWRANPDPASGRLLLRMLHHRMPRRPSKSAN